jgi:photosystem II stability/assembly factor-like uncharacterized protein
MLYIPRLLACATVLSLLGAGCLGGGGGATQADGGLWQSLNGGNSWSQLTALPGPTSIATIANVDIISLTVDPSDNTVYYAGTAADGLLYSYDAGASWARPEDATLRSGKVVNVAVDPRDVCTYYVLKTDRVMKTTTCGRSFTADTYTETRTDETLTSMILDWYAPDTLYLTSTAGDVIRTTDGGRNWTTVERVNDQLYSVIVSNSDSRILLAGSRRHGIFRSVDGGTSWTELGDTLKKDFRDSDYFYDFAQTADGKTMYMSTKYGLLTSVDIGATWTEVPLITAHGEVPILALTVDPVNGANVMYGTSNTFYSSTNGGTAWATKQLPSTREASMLTMNGSVILLGLTQPKK